MKPFKRVYWMGVLLALMIRGVVGWCQPADFDVDAFLESSKGNFCGLFTNTFSSVSNMTLHTWTYEQISQRLNADGEVVNETTDRKESVIVTEEGLRVRRKYESKGLSHDFPVNEVLFGLHLSDLCWPDLSCSDYGRMIRDKVLEICHFSYLGHQEFEGKPTISLEFHCDKKVPETEPRVSSCTVLGAGTEGTLWFDEESGIPVKAEGSYYSDFHCSSFIHARAIHKGTSWRWNMKQFDGHWVLDYWEYISPRRTSIFTGYRRYYLKWINRWSDYAKVN